MIKTRPASTAPPIIIDEELKENWSRRPCCSMIHNFFLIKILFVLLNQNINWGMNSNNKTGITGVWRDNKSGAWVATWNDADGNQCIKSFSSNKYGDAKAKAMAVAHCQRIIRSLPHYVEALRLDVDGSIKFFTSLTSFLPY